MSHQDEQKRQAALAAAALVEPSMVVGLGTGSTANYVIDELGRRVHDEGLHFVGVPTSETTAHRARTAGIALVTLDGHPEIDLTIDGADEVDPALRLIKGHGGALLHEKIVAAASRRLVIVVDASKLVQQLGERHAVPVEVVAFGWRAAARRMERLGGQPQRRVIAETGQPFVTDSGHWILDCDFGPIADPGRLEAALKDIPGVVENGLFVGLTDAVYIGKENSVEIQHATKA
ncbi:MAG: ribose-5-phosphate isomerase RpiA [Planctomycetes bacterium]|nr:ribose-5-phosphate isomerase RpiA [Planctomycetota bacterium]